MINYLSLEINNIKNITSAKIDIPCLPDVYVIAGINGSGKSTLMNALAQSFRNSLEMLEPADYDECLSLIKISYNGIYDEWIPQDDDRTGYKWTTKTRRRPKLKDIISGFYEGSIFYGTRFNEWEATSDLQNKDGFESLLIHANNFVIEQLSYILHGNKEHYKDLKRLKSFDVAEEHGFRGMPYFFNTPRGIISQYQMSSGECMLISLLHFVYNAFIRKKGQIDASKNRDWLILIDEVELALHPSAVHRLYKFAKEQLCDIYKAIVIFSTHSQEVIRRVSAGNLFFIENKQGYIEVTNPCYPNYAIRELYTNFGHDFVFLVEDNLARRLLERVFKEENLYKSKLYFILPIGGWRNVLNAYLDMIRRDMVGFSTKLICVIDGDVESEVKEYIRKNKDYESAPILFLPIPSIEKHIHKKIMIESDSVFTKEFGDKYLRVRSLSSIMNDFRSKYSNWSDEALNKKFYNEIITEITSNGIKEDVFLDNFSEDVYGRVDFSKFRENLRKKVPY